MQVKAKFYVNKITKSANFGHTSVELLPVTRKTDDNTDWAQFTPSGKLDMNVSTSTGAAQWFEDMLGKDVSITFEEAVDDGDE